MLTPDNESDESITVDGPIRFNSEWITFVGLTWKHVRKSWTNWEQFVMTILMPIIFCSVLVIQRLTFTVENHPVQKYSILELNDYWDELMSIIDQRKEKIPENISNPFIPKKIVGYAPDMFGYANIMKGASENLHSVGLRSYNTCDHLRTAIIKENLFAGVCFISSQSTSSWSSIMIDGLYPNHLKYHLIFPYACRIYNDTFIGSSWRTNSINLSVNRTDQRNIGKEDGGYVGYIREGFAPLQNAIAFSYLKLVAALKMPDFQIPKVLMCRYPSIEFSEDNVIENIDFTISLIFLLGNYYPVLLITAKIVEEKESMLRRYSKIMGVNNYVQCIAWISNYMMRAFTSTFVIIVLFKMHWHFQAPVMQHSNVFPLLLLINVYNITSICFVLMLCTLFSKTLLAAHGIALFWFITYIPFIMCMNYAQYSVLQPLFWGIIFHNTAFGLAMESILDLEIQGEGLGFGNMFDSRALRWDISVGSLLIIMVFQCLVYLLIGLYLDEVMPDDVGASKHWYFLFTFKRATAMPVPKRADDSVSTTSEASTVDRSSRANAFVYEIGGGITKVLVQINNVYKNYGDKTVLKDINLQLSDNEITVILGHNGSGKTTLLKMICGLSSITNGQIIIEGFDVSTEPRYACASIGLSMDGNLLYPDLTVEDQIRYFSFLKGFTFKESVETELEYYLEATKLGDWRLHQTKTLPMSELQKLAVCCAFVGHSRVVLLDDPATYMDFPARRLLWELLEYKKLNRAILLTSTAADLLDEIGDRVIILSNGGLQCDGSRVFIKQMYGQGYRLIVAIGPYCNIKDVTQKVREFVPNIRPLSSLGNEIIYELPEADYHIFDKLTDSLHNHMSSLGIESIQLRACNNDDIFFKLAAANPSRENRIRLRDILNGRSSFPEENKHLRFMEIRERVTGIRRILQHCQAIWSQRVKYATHFKFYYFKRVTFPAIFILLAFLVSPYNTYFKPMPAMEFSLDQYKSSVTLVERRHDTTLFNPILERYKQLIFWMGVQHQVNDTDGVLLSDYYMKKDYTTLLRMDQDHHVGASFASDYIIAWFNNVALHTVPLSLNLVHNAILRAIYGDDCSIEIFMEPLNNMLNYQNSQLRTPLSTSNILPLFISICVCCIWNTAAFTFVRLRKSGYDKVQMLAGTAVMTYWGVNFAYDTFIIAMTSVLAILSIMACQYQEPAHFYVYVWYAIVIVLCGWYVYAFNYMLAMFFVNPSHAFTFAISLQTLCVICYCHVIETYDYQYVSNAKSPYSPYFLLMPLFSFCSAIATIYYHGDFYRICVDEHIRYVSIHLEKCGVIPNCCREIHLISVKDGILVELLVISAGFVICWCIIITLHYRNICSCIHIPEDDYDAQLNDHKHRHYETTKYDPGVEAIYQEEYKIQTMKKAKLREIPLICDRLGKNFGDKVAVERVSLILHRFSCVGILARSASGVTTLFNLIARFATNSYGRVLINGRNVAYNSELVQKMVGYGREKMISLPVYTVKDTLEHACKLRSYPPEYIDGICVNLAKTLGFFHEYNKQLSVLSLGMLNRINCAITVMGNPEIILLDMATVGIDSAGKREVWNVLKRMQSKGASILVSTASLRDCRRYCDRVTYMAHGRFYLFGSTWSLDTLITENYQLEGKFHFQISYGSSNYLYTSSLTKLTDFIYRNFPNSVLKYQRGNSFLFLIPVESSTISNIFITLMNNASNLGVEDFEVSRHVPEAFIDFWGKKKNFAPQGEHL